MSRQTGIIMALIWSAGRRGGNESDVTPGIRA